MSDLLDRGKPVRPGEELDLSALSAWLDRALGARGAITLTQFPAGHSNLTYLLEIDGGPELVLRRPPFGSKVKTAHDMGREHRILSRLHAVYPKAPRALAHCDDLTVLGAPFYVMERVRGTILRRKLPEALGLDAPRMRATCAALVDGLAELHAVDYAAAGLADLGKPEGYVVRQVEGWTKRYGDSRTDDIPEVEEVAAWLAERMHVIAAKSGAALVHNDWKFDNLVLDPGDPTRIVGVLDWEMSTLGDPLMDLGTALSYWVEAGDADEAKMFAFGPTFAPGAYTRREVVARYAEQTGRDVSDILFHYAFALFKTAVVAQQIYYRFKHGLTKDERFAMMIVGVRILSAQARSAIERGTIDP